MRNGKRGWKARDGNYGKTSGAGERERKSIRKFAEQTEVFNMNGAAG